jgi:hypothetical protein
MVSLLKHKPRQFWQPWHRKAAALVQASQIQLSRWRVHYQQLFTESCRGFDTSLDAYIKRIPEHAHAQVEQQLLDPFSLSDLIVTWSRVNRSAAQGIDHLPTQLLGISARDENNNLQYPVLQALVPFFNAILHTHNMPDIWNISIIKPIYKNKGEIDDPTSFRPISLSSSCYRMFMAALTFRLERILIQHSIIPDTQYAFTEKRNCNHAVTVLHHAVMAMDDSLPIAAAFIDLKQAYDRVQHDMLFHTLQVIGLPVPFIDIVRRSYEAAQFTVQTSCGFTPLVQYSRGVKQGCPMSPLLFNIYFATVDRYLAVHAQNIGLEIGFTSLLRAIYYADDVVLLARSWQHLQTLLDTFEQCTSKLGMMVNPAKSAVLIFNSPNTRTGQIMSVKGPIFLAQEYCYLGTVVNPIFKWDLARKHRANLAEHDRDVVQSYLKSQHLYHMQAIATHFNANVMQTLLYGCPVWGWSFFLNWNLVHNPFQQQLSLLVKDLLHLPCNTPDVAIMCESGVWPILYYAMKQAAKFVDGLPATNSDVLLHLTNLPLPQGTVQQYKSLAQRISALAPGAELPQTPTHGQFLIALEQAYMNLLQEWAQDPRDPNNAHLKTSSYLQWVWNGELHKRPKFYDVDLNVMQYNLCMHTRFLHSYLPAYHQVYKPLFQRVCPLCHSNQAGPCDLKHVLAECPYTLQIYQQTVGDLGPEALQFPYLLSSKNSDVWKYIATCLQLVLRHIRIRRKHRQMDD